MMLTLDWSGCYGGSHKDVICDDAFGHPAKFAAKLIQRIYRHGLERGYWQEGDLIADPFAGVGIGGIHAASFGRRDHEKKGSPRIDFEEVLFVQKRDR